MLTIHSIRRINNQACLQKKCADWILTPFHWLHHASVLSNPIAEEWRQAQDLIWVGQGILANQKIPLLYEEISVIMWQDLKYKCEWCLQNFTIISSLWKANFQHIWVFASKQAMSTERQWGNKSPVKETHRNHIMLRWHKQVAPFIMGVLRNWCQQQVVNLR